MHFTVEAQERIRSHIGRLGLAERPVVALDATAGNGFDTLFLAELIGETGTLFAIDLQEAAIRSAQERVSRAVYNHSLSIATIQWIAGCHSELKQYLQSARIPQIHIAMFNLGYLPLGDKSIITTCATTLKALDAAAQYLAPDGILSVLSYPGHSGGSEEHRAVLHWFENNRAWLPSSMCCDENNARSPVLFIATKT